MNITQYILEAAATVAVAVITRYLVPYIKGRIALINADKLTAMINTAVRAAEQQIKGAKLGEEKKDFVLSLLEKSGVIVTDMVDAMIEAAVKAMNDEVLTLSEAVLGKIEEAVE
jgi:hypothetical protein